MPLEGLDEFSEQFASRLFREFPEFERLARADGRTLLLELTPPGGSSRGSLWVSTDGDEVTIGFDRFHQHFGWSEAPNDEAFGQALALLREILEERQVVGVVMEGAEWRESMLLEPGAWPDVAPKQWAYLRSWRGTYDAQRGEGAPVSE